MIGQRLAHYLIVEKIGAGGMGVVYRARDERLNRDVALKVLPTGSLADEEARRRFRNEAFALSRINHPNIATIHDFNSHEGIDFVVMEYIQGEDLAKRIEAGPLPVADALRIGRQIADALEEAHQQGIIHRDLKPGNILVTPKGQVKVLDFGLARIFDPEGDPDLTSTSLSGDFTSTMGTLAYMSPEQLRGNRADERSDIWSFGVVLFEMTTGKRPFDDRHAPRLIDAIFNSAPQRPRNLNPDISPEVEQVILKTLEKNPELRYQSARELRVDHERLTGGISGPVATAPRPVWYKNWLVWAAAGPVVLLLLWMGISDWRPAAPPRAERAVVLMGDFQNDTGEPALEQTLRDLLTVSVEQSRHVRVFPSSRLPEVLRRMGRDAPVKIDEALGREICQREGLQAVVLGSVRSLGDRYVVVVRAIGPSGQDLVSAQSQAATMVQIPAALDEIAQQLRTGLGESLAAVQQTSAPLASVTSPSLDAVRFFTQGRQKLYAGDPQEAIIFFRRALELDPQFASAHEYLGIAHIHLNDMVRAEQHLADAAKLADRVTEAERHKILGDYHMVRRNYEEACAHYQVLVQLQPLDPAPYINLGWCNENKQDFDAAVAASEKAVELSPGPRPKINLASQVLRRGDVARAAKLAQEILDELPSDAIGRSLLSHAQFLSGRPEEARATLEPLIGRGSATELTARIALADLAMATGRYRDARAHLETGIIAAEKGGNQFEGTRAAIALAELLIDMGSTSQLAAALRRVPAPTEDPNLILLLGRIQARGGLLPAARETARRLDAIAADKPYATLRSFQHMMNAELALATGDLATAVEQAETAVRYENSPIALETAARTYAAAGKYAEAIRAYEELVSRGGQRILAYDRPGTRSVSRAYYELGRLAEKNGDAARARIHFEKFLQYWSNPDEGLAPAIHARRALGKSN